MHARHIRAFIFLSILLPLQVAHLARAQQNLPNVTGLVEDPAGRAIVAASITGFFSLCSLTPESQSGGENEESAERSG